jgi:hypothetical protein
VSRALISHWPKVPVREQIAILGRGGARFSGMGFKSFPSFPSLPSLSWVVRVDAGVRTPGSWEGLRTAPSLAIMAKPRNVSHAIGSSVIVLTPAALETCHSMANGANFLCDYFMRFQKI